MRAYRVHKATTSPKESLAVSRVDAYDIKTIEDFVLSKLKENSAKEFNWNTTRVNERVPKGFWRRIDVQRKFMDIVGRELGIKSLDDWYNVKTKELLLLGGSSILNHYNNSLHKLLFAVYPEKDWVDWKFVKVPRSFWRNDDNIKRFLQWVAKKIKIQTYEDWYKISLSDIEKHVDYRFPAGDYFQFIKCVQRAFPTEDWKFWKFRHVNKEMWEDVGNLRKFMDDFAKAKQFTSLDDWYKVTKKDLWQHEGKFKSNLSMADLVQHVYPDHNWVPFLFTKNSSSGWWKSKSNQRAYMDWLGTQLNFKSIDDYYNITRHDIENNKGGRLLHYYRSMAHLLESLYPEHKWDFWKFQRVKRYRTKEDLIKYMEYLQKDLKISSIEDWYRISQPDIRSRKGSAMLDNFGGLPKMLKIMYPDHYWDNYRLKQRIKLSSQRWLRVHVQDLFPNQAVIENYQIVNFELDVFVPDLKLAFEFNGKQHYETTNIFGPIHVYKENDKIKRSECEKLGITLVEVPYWWDHKKNSLTATIHNIRPDLITDVPDGAIPIPKTFDTIKIG